MSNIKVESRFTIPRGQLDKIVADYISSITPKKVVRWEYNYKHTTDLYEYDETVVDGIKVVVEDDLIEL